MRLILDSLGRPAMVARELAAIGESGEKGTLEGGTEKRKADETIESDTGRAASVLDRK